MNDYLWDKTGSDSEIEQLEGLLAAFAHRQTAEPAFVTASVPAPAPKRLFGLRLGFAFGALVLASIAVFVWLPRVPTRDAVAINVPERVSEPIIDPTVNLAPVIQTAVATKPAFRPVRAVLRTTPAKRNKADVHPEKFTKEEEIAYQKLMTALAITSEQLKIVRDKINGTEE